MAIASIFDPNTINSTFECFSKKGKLSKLQKVEKVLNPQTLNPDTWCTPCKLDSNSKPKP